MISPGEAVRMIRRAARGQQGDRARLEALLHEPPATNRDAETLRVVQRFLTTGIAP